MELREIFKRLGYPLHSEKVYEQLTNSKEPLLVSDLSKKCHTSRVVIYRCLQKFKKDNIVSEVKTGKRKAYQVSTSAKLQNILSVYETKTERLVKHYVKLREKETPPNIRFLYGKEGIREAFNDVIEHTKKGDTFFRYTSEQDLALVNSYLANDYRHRRDKKKLERQVISNFVSGSQKRSRLERFIKFIPSGVDQFKQNIIELIYGDRVSFIDLTTKEVIIIENRQLAEFQKVIFKLLYKRL